MPEQSAINPRKLIRDNQEWVLKTHREWLEKKKEIPQRNFKEGSELMVLGEDKTIKVEKRKKNRVSEDIFLARHLMDRTGLKDQIEKALKTHIRNEIENLLEDYRDEINGNYGKVFIRDQKTRWGSCSSQDNLNFNWRLVFAPYEVMEYVVVHEMVHLEEKHHGERFWQRLEELMPEYHEHKTWLDENSHKLIFELEDRE